MEKLPRQLMLEPAFPSSSKTRAGGPRQSAPLAGGSARSRTAPSAMTRIEWDADTVRVDARLIAGPLRTTPQMVLALIRAGRITARCERGVDEDVGRFRLSFHRGTRRLQLLVDSGGNVLGQSVIILKSRRSVRADSGPSALLATERGR